MTKKVSDPAGIYDNNSINMNCVGIAEVKKDKKYVLVDTGSTKFHCISPSEQVIAVIKAFDGGNPNKNKGRKEEKEQGE